MHDCLERQVLIGMSRISNDREGKGGLGGNASDRFTITALTSSS